ncbi:hypothetical protein [Kitasatospora sp. NPDC015120]|uniref:hypothetical protein n=1 Tax=Kitasatospora sp. NPDC015120 TaxID=3364023 RepID=UPI0036F46615
MTRTPHTIPTQFEPCAQTPLAEELDDADAEQAGVVDDGGAGQVEQVAPDATSTTVRQAVSTGNDRAAGPELAAG